MTQPDRDPSSQSFISVIDEANGILRGLRWRAIELRKDIDKYVEEVAKDDPLHNNLSITFTALLDLNKMQYDFVRRLREMERLLHSYQFITDKSGQFRGGDGDEAQPEMIEYAESQIARLMQYFPKPETKGINE